MVPCDSKPLEYWQQGHCSQTLRILYKESRFVFLKAAAFLVLPHNIFFLSTTEGNNKIRNTSCNDTSMVAQSHCLENALLLNGLIWCIFIHTPAGSGIFLIQNTICTHSLHYLTHFVVPLFIEESCLVFLVLTTLLENFS